MASRESRLFSARNILGGLIAVTALYLLFGGNLLLRNLMSDRVVLHGRWNNYKAQRYVIGQLRKYGDAGDYGFAISRGQDPAAHHFIHDYFPLNYRDGKGYLVAAYTKPVPFDCAACAPRISLMEFRQADDGWALAAKSIGEITAGSWGSPPERIDVIRIGTDWYGVVIEYSAGNNGMEETLLTIYTNIDDEFRKVFTLVTDRTVQAPGAKASTAVSWEVEVLPPEEPGPAFYDIRARRVDAAALLDDTTDPEEKRIYRFDGDKYVQIQ